MEVAKVSEDYDHYDRDKKQSHFSSPFADFRQQMVMELPNMSA
jgi:hypothetical protein